MGNGRKEEEGREEREMVRIETRRKGWEGDDKGGRRRREEERERGLQ